jgi:hypothetical protein
MRNKWAIGAIFMAVAGALAGLAIWLGGGQSDPASPEITPAGAEVATTSSTSAVPTSAAGVAVSDSQAPGAGPSSVAGKPAPRQATVQADEPAVTTTPAAPTATVATTLPPGQSSAPPPPQVCRWVHDGPTDHIGHEVCD